MLPEENVEVIFESPGKSDYGMKHWRKHHIDDWKRPDAVEIFAEIDVSNFVESQSDDENHTWKRQTHYYYFTGSKVYCDTVEARETMDLFH